MAGQTRINGNLIDTGTDPEDIVSISAGDARYPKLDGPNTLSGDLTVSGAINANNALSVAGDITASGGSFTGNVSATLDALSRIVNSLPPLVAFPGAAAAYSLRDFNATNQGVVRVRRSSDNSEQDFNAAEIQNGSLTSFVNEQNPLPSTKVADFDSGAAAAYSLRYVSDSYTGPVVRVRRDSDNNEQDFTPAEIEDGSLESFCGSGDGLVTTWYDQSGNSSDAIQTTASDQPKMVSAGVLVTENGRPALDFDGVGDFLGFASFSASDFQVHVVARKNTSTGVFVSGGEDVNNRWDFGPRISTDTRILVEEGNVIERIDTGTNYINLYGLFTANNSELVVNGSIISTGSITASIQSSPSYDFYIGQRGFGTTSNFAEANISEIILYSSDQSSNRESIETDINSYYQIYGGDNEGHVTTWYDQSGNGNDATQTTASEQPKIVTAGVLVTENGKAALDFDNGQNLAFSGTGSGYDGFLVVHILSGFDFGLASSDGSDLLFIPQESDNSFEINRSVGNPEYYVNSSLQNWQTRGDVYSALTNQNIIYFNNADLNQINRLSKDDNRGGESLYQEIILYPSDQSSNRELIETNINNHYGIY